MKLTTILLLSYLLCLSFSQISLNLQETPIVDSKSVINELLLTTSINIGEANQ